MQPQIEVPRSKSIPAFAVLLLLLGGIWLALSKDFIVTLDDINSGKEIVDINVYGLWLPLGIFGIFPYLFVGFGVTIATKKKASDVWGQKGQMASNIVVGMFAGLGIVFAFVCFSWMVNTLENTGYNYCKPLSRISAMGRHDVYVASPELCSKK
ncbi:hypothetical protein L4D06_23355 [Enterovibrio makurazakiensis]|uniref:hypothetical protein n=1 Tax=Enterovibrio makurazakiensis TaxID=2910232 RepID=UPI003D1D1E21